LPSPINLSPRVSKREIDTLQATINKLTKQLVESSTAQLKSNDECNLAKKELENSKKDANYIKLELEKLKNEMNSNKGNIENEERMTLSIDNYKLQLSQSNDKITIESKKYENMVNAIRNISNDMTKMANSSTLVSKGSFDKSIESNDLVK
jgi:DNA repair exonuclease SbcCD ATPase subunit